MCKFTEIWGPVFKAFEERYPHVSSIIVDWYPCGQNEIIVKTNKGDKVIFNYIGETIRILERGTDTIDKDDITEEQWRKEFSARLCNKMAAAGIPRWELSRITGISEPTLSKYMNGRSTPSTFNTRRLAKALGCPIQELSDFML